MRYGFAPARAVPHLCRVRRTAEPSPSRPQADRCDADGTAQNGPRDRRGRVEGILQGDAPDRGATGARSCRGSAAIRSFGRCARVADRRGRFSARKFDRQIRRTGKVTPALAQSVRGCRGDRCAAPGQSAGGIRTAKPRNTDALQGSSQEASRTPQRASATGAEAPRRLQGHPQQWRFHRHGGLVSGRGSRPRDPVPRQEQCDGGRARPWIPSRFATDERAKSQLILVGSLDFLRETVRGVNPDNETHDLSFLTEVVAAITALRDITRNGLPLASFLKPDALRPRG
jgi:hypothetical protein